MFSNPDPYNTGTPKYSTATDIYDALCALVQTEEMSILSEIVPDVSYENQDYYYTYKGDALKEQFEILSDCGDKMWLMDLAIWQIDQSEIHDTVYQALHNSDLAKRLGFKQLFVEHMLDGKYHYYPYREIAEEYADELSNLNRYDIWNMSAAFAKVMAARGHDMHKSPYPAFCYALCEKARNLHLQKETRLIAECRAHLSAYDDFILGLRMNQALHEAQERQFTRMAAQLQANYDEKIGQLYMFAERMGITPASIGEIAPKILLPERTLDQDLLEELPLSTLIPRQPRDNDAEQE